MIEKIGKKTMKKKVAEIELTDEENQYLIQFNHECFDGIRSLLSIITVIRA